ncbi:MAG: hypothetical protein LBJ41_03185 [Treponema sp.]|nr:hypothetical protein [Treponema sp.]
MTHAVYANSNTQGMVRDAVNVKAYLSVSQTCDSRFIRGDVHYGKLLRNDCRKQL